MTTFVINSALVALTGTVNPDDFILNTASEVSLFGLEGNDTLSAGATVGGINLASLVAFDGDDVIRFTGGGAITASKASINLGNGNDRFSADISAAPEFTILGGQGNDTIVITGAAAGLIMRDSRAIGGGGNDLMDLSLASGSGFYLAGGGGNDSLSFSATNGTGELLSGTIAGGGGEDRISADFQGAAVSGLYFAGDDPRTLDAYDGADLINVSGSNNINGCTINAQGGNDTILLLSIGTANLVNGNTGNDSLSITGVNSAVRTTLAAGAGTDVITLNAFSSVGSGFFVQGGGDNDSISLSASLSNTGISIAGGEGGDLFNLTVAGTLTGSAAASREGIGLFYYGSVNESTAGNTDVFSGVGSAGLTGLDIGISAINGTIAANTANTGIGCSIVGGVAIFTSTLSQALSTRVSTLNSLVSINGAGVIFSTVSNNGTSNNFLFVQGGTDDLVVRFATAEASGLRIIGGNYHVSFD